MGDVVVMYLFSYKFVWQRLDPGSPQLVTVLDIFEWRRRGEMR